MATVKQASNSKLSPVEPGSQPAAITDHQVLQKLKRIYRLSIKPPNPSFAYRHLEDIASLTASLLKDIGAEHLMDELTTLDTDQSVFRAIWNRTSTPITPQ